MGKESAYIFSEGSIQVVSKHRKRFLTSLPIRGMEMKTKWYHFMYTRRNKIKNTEIASVGKDVDKFEPSYELLV